MRSQEQRKENQSLRQLLGTHRRNLRILEIQRAEYGIDIPVRLMNQIAHEEEQVRVLEDRLAQLQEREYREGWSDPVPDISEFVNREDVLCKLERALEDNKMIIIQGLPGTGKSWLASSLFNYLIENQLYREEEMCWVNLKASNISIVMDKLASFLGRNGDTALRNALGEESQRFQDKVKNLIHSLNAHRYILFFDDYHYVEEDDKLEEMFDDLARYLKNTRIVITTRRRPGFFKPIYPGVFRETIEGLPSVAVHELLGEIGIDRRTIERIIAKTRGVPLAIMLIAKNPDYPPEDILKEDIFLREVCAYEGFLGGWFKTLSDQEKALMTRLSVYREPVPLEAIQYVHSEADVKSVILPLVSLQGISIFKGVRYSAHDIVQEFCYFHLENPVEAHLNASRYYEDLIQAREGCPIDPHPYREAHYHLLKAHKVGRALRILDSIMPILYVRGQFTNLINMLLETEKQTSLNPKQLLYEARILERWGKHDESKNILSALQNAEDEMLRCVALYETANIHRVEGDYPKALEMLAEALALCEQLGDQTQQVTIKYRTAQVLTYQGEYQRALELLKESLSLARCIEYQDGIIMALTELGHVQYYHEARYEEAMQSYEEALNVARQIGDRWAQSRIYHLIARIHINRGELEEGRKLLEEERVIWEDLKFQRGLGSALYQLARISLFIGDMEQARDLSQQGLEIMRSLDNRRMIAYFLHWIAIDHALEGEYVNALQVYEQTLKTFREIEERNGISMTLHRIAQVLFQMGEFAQAITNLEEALEIQQKLKDRKEIAKCHRLLAKIALQQGDLPQALDHAEQARKIYERARFFEGFTDIYHVLGTIYARQGKDALAQQYRQRGEEIASQIREVSESTLQFI